MASKAAVGSPVVLAPCRKLTRADCARDRQTATSRGSISMPLMFARGKYVSRVNTSSPREHPKDNRFKGSRWPISVAANPNSQG